MRIVAVLNQKGGVGKTTTAVNLGAALALRGRRVLLVDADPQGNLTDHLGLDPREADATLYDVLTDGTTIADATIATKTKGLSVVPSEPDLAAAETELSGVIGREVRLRKALEAVPADTYDWVLIDCPPSLGLLSLNAMTAADELLVTLQTEYFALKGLEQLDKVIELVKEHLNPRLRMLGILPTLVNPVTLLAREVIDEIRSHYGNIVLKSRIRQNVSLAEAPSRGSHIFTYKPSSPGADDYLRLADEIEGVRDTRATSQATRRAIEERRRLKEEPIIIEGHVDITERRVEVPPAPKADVPKPAVTPEAPKRTMTPEAPKRAGTDRGARVPPVKQAPPEPTSAPTPPPDRPRGTESNPAVPPIATPKRDRMDDQAPRRTDRADVPAEKKN